MATEPLIINKITWSKYVNCERLGNGTFFRLSGILLIKKTLQHCALARDDMMVAYLAWHVRDFASCEERERGGSEERQTRKRLPPQLPRLKTKRVASA